MKRLKFNIKDRRILSIILCVAVISIFSLTMAYAALNAVLNISGNAEVVASSWDVHFENIVYVGDDEAPRISSPTLITFYPILNMPGDRYEFTVDIVNDGSIDAMINDIKFDSNLTATELKYLNYDMSYANGENIETLQIVEAGKFVRLKFMIEYKKDINPSDLPTSQKVINFSIGFDYTQSDENGVYVSNDGVVGGDSIENGELSIGSEVCLGEECFHFLGSELSDDGSYIDTLLLSKYNLYVGNKVTEFDNTFSLNNNKSVVEPLQYQVVKQDSKAIGLNYNELEDGSADFLIPFYGTIPFAKTSYWTKNSTYDEMMNNSENLITPYLDEYKIYLNNLGYNILDISILSTENLTNYMNDEELFSAEFFTSTSYWISAPVSDSILAVVQKGYGITFAYYTNFYGYGIRPLIVYRYYK